jgi:hypothetical protein
VIDLRVCPIVEGHGEVEASRTLIERIWREIVGGTYVEVLRPIRQPRGKLVKDDELRRAVEFASAKLKESTDPSVSLVLVIIDADSDLPCMLAPKLQSIVSTACYQGVYSAVVLANIMYETWFVAAAESLTAFLDICLGAPPDPEGQRCGKTWIQKRLKSTKYSETVDQPAMTASMDLRKARLRSRSFDKLCRELEKHRPA